jgi:hypothetical protein
MYRNTLNLILDNARPPRIVKAVKWANRMLAAFGQP